MWRVKHELCCPMRPAVLSGRTGIMRVSGSHVFFGACQNVIPILSFTKGSRRFPGADREPGMGRSDFRGAVRPGHPSLAGIFRREKPDALQDCQCTARQTAAPCRATMEAFRDLRLDSRTFVRLLSYRRK